MHFTVTILGCGSAAPTLSRRPSSQVISVRDQKFLIDCGEGTQLQLRKYKVKFQKIKQIFISHLHGDHVYGLIGLLSTYHLLGRKETLELYGPSDLKDFIESQLKLTQTELNYPLEFHAISTDKKIKVFENKVVTVWSFPLKHRIECYGYLFHEKPLPRSLRPAQLKKHKVSIAYAEKIKSGENVLNEEGKEIDYRLLSKDPPQPRQYAYCSDTVYTKELSEVVKGVDLLYHEATFMHDMQERAIKTLHTTALQAGKIAKAADAKQLMIGHYSARYTDVTDLLNEASTEFPNVLAAEDGKIVEIHH